MITAGELIEILKEIEDDAVVLIQQGSAENAPAGLAETTTTGFYGEDGYGQPRLVSQAPDGSRPKAILIGL